ncbi:HNH endonuclease [Antarcticirhabdus aurantiaca]|uniref:HNH endonuclease n=1 Tax=Antarcticirhabdus aurantiaca TaxID=2606717 RepID=UPI0018EF03BF|nr:HNH endonuclease [Antarcticirhabdus aurantiaca]
MAAHKMCDIVGCDKHVRAKRLCAMHYQRQYKWGDPNGGRTGKPFAGKVRSVTCTVPGCDKPHAAKGFCSTHYERHRQGQDLRIAIKPRRHGEKFIDKYGYVRFTERGHPQANSQGSVLEHRAVMAAKLGRDLLPGENVHHINGDRADNRPENLELWVTSQPSGQRPEDLVQWAREILARYGPATALP